MNSWVTRLFDRTGKSSSKSKKTKSTKGKPHSVNHPYRAVTVYGREDCCAAAERIRGQKFLAAHAPQLPLGGCTHPNQCRCKYKHMQDRREELRRDADYGLPGRSYVANERRLRRDRRRSQAKAPV